MKWLRRLLVSLGIFFMAFIVLAAHYCHSNSFKPAESGAGRLPLPTSEAERQRVAGMAASQRRFISGRGYDSHLCFLLDMRVFSGRNRFFVYDLDRDSILLAGLVAHGCGAERFSERPSFSNLDGSHCSSLGRYRVGSAYAGAYGRSYKLYGLDSSNDQAYNRHVVLHSYAAVPEEETDPYPICNSLGCPMVAPGFLNKIQPIIDRARKPVLLFVFN